MLAASPVTRSLLATPYLPSQRIAEKRIVVMGDSLVYGYGDPEGGGWVERLRRQWLQPETAGHAIYNLGVRGDTVQRVSQRLVQEFQTRGEFRNRVPDRLVLAVGMNDTARVGKSMGKPYTPLDDFTAQMHSLLEQAQALCPTLFIGMPPVLEDRMPFSEVLYYSHADQFLYKEITKRACQARSLPYLDIFDLWLGRGQAWWRSRLSSDGLHPNSLGYRALLQDIATWQPFEQLL